MSDRYVVWGNPIAHSLSPDIHRAFAAQTGEEIIYSAQEVALNRFAHIADSFFSADGKGANVTQPFKHDAYTYADHLTEEAQNLGTVNTLERQADGTIKGWNTDGIGLCRDLSNNLKWSISNATVLVLGAGGAARGIVPYLHSLSPHSITLANRTLQRAIDIQRTVRFPLKVCPWHSLNCPFDVIIYAVSPTKPLNLPKAILHPQTRCYDMNYGLRAQKGFLSWIKQHGVYETSDGLGMLVEQAAESFYHWRGICPHTQPVIQQMRQLLLSAK